MTVDIRTAPIYIDATPVEVFDALTDIPSWKTWAAGFGLSSRRVQVGGRAIIRLPLLPGPRPPLPGTFTDVDRGRKLAWGGGIPGVLSAVHAFELTADGTGTTLEHYETFTGPASIALVPVQGKILAVYERMNAGLRSYVEAGA
ncbi:MAG: hypothetical protein ACI9AD_000071 [Nitriliruptoraceae bacterium]|jgi:hypothetical protein